MGALNVCIHCIKNDSIIKILKSQLSITINEITYQRLIYTRRKVVCEKPL